MSSDLQPGWNLWFLSYFSFQKYIAWLHMCMYFIISAIITYSPLIGPILTKLWYFNQSSSHYKQNDNFEQDFLISSSSLNLRSHDSAIRYKFFVIIWCDRSKSAKLTVQRSTNYFCRLVMCHRLNDGRILYHAKYFVKRRLHAGQIKIHFSECGYRFGEIYHRNFNSVHLKFNKRHDPHNCVSIWSTMNNVFCACTENIIDWYKDDMVFALKEILCRRFQGCQIWGLEISYIDYFSKREKNFQIQLDLEYCWAKSWKLMKKYCILKITFYFF